MRIDSGASYAGFPGMLFAFNGNEAIGVVGAIHQQVQRFTFDMKEALQRQRQHARIETQVKWKYAKNVPRYLDQNASLAYAGGTVVLGNENGLLFLSADTGEPTHTINEVRPTNHGIAIASGCVYVVGTAGKVLCLKSN